MKNQPGQWHTMSQAARIMKADDYGRTKIFKRLRYERILLAGNHPVEDYLVHEFFKYNPAKVQTQKRATILISDKGMEFVKIILLLEPIPIRIEGGWHLIPNI